MCRRVCVSVRAQKALHTQTAPKYTLAQNPPCNTPTSVLSSAPEPTRAHTTTRGHTHMRGTHTHTAKAALARPCHRCNSPIATTASRGGCLLPAGLCKRSLFTLWDPPPLPDALLWGGKGGPAPPCPLPSPSKPSTSHPFPSLPAQRTNSLATTLWGSRFTKMGGPRGAGDTQLAQLSPIKLLQPSLPPQKEPSLPEPSCFCLRFASTHHPPGGPPRILGWSRGNLGGVVGTPRRRKLTGWLAGVPQLGPLCCWGTPSGSHPFSGTGVERDGGTLLMGSPPLHSSISP